MEIWKDIKGYEGLYQVSNLGRVKSLDRIVKDNTKDRYQKLKGCILKSTSNGNDYQVVYLTKNSKRKNYYVHRLVAEYFIANPNNYKQVNHKDLNKHNNSVDNLEWITDIDNKKHYQSTEKAKVINTQKGIQMHNKLLNKLEKNKDILINGYIIQNKTIAELSKLTNIGRNSISKFLKYNGIKIVRKPIYRTFNRDAMGRFAKTS